MADPRPQDEVRATPILMVGIVSVILFAAGVFAISAWFTHLENDEADVKARQPVMPPDLRSARDRQEMDLVTYGWVDREKGIVRLPIDRAMELVVKETK
jgi:hypothetical protein